MNQNVYKGKWRQIQGKSKVWWGNLTQNELKKAGGKFEKLVGFLQEKYGRTQQKMVLLPMKGAK
jgi:uncharacterized protein YjbJ (UPF0337 family)